MICVREPLTYLFGVKEYGSVREEPLRGLMV